VFGEYLMAKKKILVCGATGFIGRNVAEYFAKQESVEVTGVFHKRPAYKNPEIKWLQADLTRLDDVERVMKDVDVVIQAASVTSGVRDVVSRPFVHITDSSVMNSLLLRASFENKVDHFIFFSCSVMYASSDYSSKENDFNVDTEIDPKYFGGAWNKIYFEKMCEFFSTQGSTRYTAIRHSNIFGPHDKFDLEKSHVFGATVTKVMQASNPGEIVAWGEGKEERDLLYISDLIEFIRLALERQKKPFFLCNVGRGKSISIKDLIKKIIKISGKDIHLEFDKSKPSIATKVALDSTLAKESFDWKPAVTLEEGIQKTLEWYKANVSLG
jgi:GDP-L-fucose synthase